MTRSLETMKPEKGTTILCTAWYMTDFSPIIQGLGGSALEDNLGWNHLKTYGVQLPATYCQQKS